MVTFWKNAAYACNVPSCKNQVQCINIKCVVSKKRLGFWPPKTFGRNIRLNMVSVYLAMLWYHPKIEKGVSIDHYSSLNGPSLYKNEVTTIYWSLLYRRLTHFQNIVSCVIWFFLGIGFVTWMNVTVSIWLWLKLILDNEA